MLCKRSLRDGRPILIVGTVMILVLSGVLPAFAQQPAFDFRALEPGVAAAVFAGGCFWCLEKPFEETPGVIEAISGYTGGSYERPTYRIVAHGGTGHREALLVLFDPTEIDYLELLETFWINIDPSDDHGQFCDRGETYRSAIFYRSARQRVLAERSHAAVASAFGAPIYTEILPIAPFWIAEEYHQNYYIEHSFNYGYFRRKCGRDDRLTEIWGAAEERRGLIRELIAAENNAR